MKIEIRDAVFADLNPALKLDRESFGPDSWTMLDYLWTFSERSIRKYSAFADGKFAGFACMEFDTDEQAACLMTIAVVPEFRRHGIAAKLLAACESAFQGKDYYLCVDIENAAAIGFYVKSGYAANGVIHSYYMNGHDALVMIKEAS